MYMLMSVMSAFRARLSLLRKAWKLTNAPNMGADWKSSGIQATLHLVPCARRTLWNAGVYCDICRIIAAPRAVTPSWPGPRPELMKVWSQSLTKHYGAPERGHAARTFAPHCVRKCRHTSGQNDWPRNAIDVQLYSAASSNRPSNGFFHSPTTNLLGSVPF